MSKLSSSKSSIYLWMFIPFLVMQIGIFPDYWPNFKGKDWGTHIHFWTASSWFIFLISQPILVSKGNIEKHRTNGIIGFFIAGGVIFSAFALYSNDIRTSIFFEENNYQAGYLTYRHFTTLLIVETIEVLAFSYAILMSIVKRKLMEEHAWWLMSSVYFIMMPTVGRGMFYVSAYFVGGEDQLKAWHVDVPSSIIISGLALAMVWKFNKWKHPASWMAILITPIIYVLWSWLANIDTVHQWIKKIVIMD
ncbi:MAG: hypothetical protein RIM99_05175 [Cyclobacteriaceae bacterium]